MQRSLPPVSAVVVFGPEEWWDICFASCANRELMDTDVDSADVPEVLDNDRSAMLRKCGEALCIFGQVSSLGFMFVSRCTPGSTDFAIVPSASGHIK